MALKIEINYLNIDNYPYMEKHFEEMAAKGWLINKVYTGVFFLYKKISPQKLNFSISPYEMETAFTRKSKEDLQEFQTVSQNVGWSYATKSYDLHIYFKNKDSEAMPIQTDEEEEFKTLEIIARRYLKTQYILLPLLIFLAWLNIGSIFSNIYSMKNGFTQIASFFIPIGLLGSIIHIIELRRFIKKNRKNIDLGKSLEFNRSGHLIHKILLFLLYVGVLAIVIYALYSAIFLRNKFTLLVFLPILIGVIVGSLYRIFVKPSKKGLDFKKLAFVITLLVAIALSIPVGIFSFGIVTESNKIPDPSRYRVLSFNDFTDKEIEIDGMLLRNASILVPKSYEYTSFTGDNGYLRTEYSNVLNEGLAKNLVNRYINQGENALIGNYSREIRSSFEDGVYDTHLNSSGFTEEDFYSLTDENYDDAIDSAKKIIIDRSIVEDSDLWNLDDAYYLNYEKNEIILRDGKKVFYLAGMDFSDQEVIEISKSNLELY